MLSQRYQTRHPTGAESLSEKSLSEKLVSDDRESSRRVRLLILLLVGQISAHLLLFVRVMSYDFTAQWNV